MHKRSRLRLWIFRLGAVTFPFAVLGVVNFVLYCCDVGYNARLVLPVTKSDHHRFHFNTEADVAYSRLSLNGPEPRQFVLPKPDHVFRIVVVGASTVRGFPYAAELAFPRQLELMLGTQMPATQVEVLNAGIVAINSFAVVDVVRQSFASKPDLIVVYTGHNEFYGPGGVGSNLVPLSPSIYPTMVRLRRFRLVQAVSRFGRKVENKPLTELLARDLTIPLDSPGFAAAEKYYRRNLTKMADLAERAGVQIMFCSPACNLRDQSPLNSIARSDLALEQRASQDVKLAEAASCLLAGSFAAATRAVEEAGDVDPGFALVEYRRAQCFEAGGKFDEAARAYSLARDLDGCRFRAPHCFQQTVREVATEQSRRGVYFVDVNSAISQSSRHRLPSNDLFLEHVHFNGNGHRLVALTLAREITERVSGMPWNSALLPTGRELDEQLGITIYDHALALFKSYKLLLNPPLKNSPDCQIQLRHVNELIGEIKSQMSPLESEVFGTNIIGQPAGRTELCNTMGWAMFGLGEYQKASVLFELGIRRRPWDAVSYFGAAASLKELGRIPQAKEMVIRGLEITPEIESLLKNYDHLADLLREYPDLKKLVGVDAG